MPIEIEGALDHFLTKKIGHVVLDSSFHQTNTYLELLKFSMLKDTSLFEVQLIMD